MSENMGIRSMNTTERLIDEEKLIVKPLSKVEKSKGGGKVAVDDKNGVKSSPLAHSVSVPSILRRQESLVSSNLSMNASCSSDASTNSIRGRASTGRMCRKSSKSIWKKQLASKARNGVDQELLLPEVVQGKRRCSWAAVSTDPSYVAFHDEEWGVPAHDDKKLFEALVFSSALAELAWPAILSKRHVFREVFADFDPITVAKLSEKKLTAPGSLACSLLSEVKLRSIIENARQVLKVIEEFGSLSFDNYIWSFVNHKPVISSIRFPPQLPIKSPKVDVISKDLVRRNFRGVGPTAVYSFMQVSGLRNDHLVTCFRFHDCKE